MAAFVVGQIVRPVRVHERADGSLQDWAGIRSAQAWIELDLGVTPTTSASFFDRSTSQYGFTVANEQSYSIWAWDIDGQAYAVNDYPESALELAEVDSVATTAVFAQPDLSTVPGTRSANVTRFRE